jgi:hypothetical protein
MGTRGQKRALYVCEAFAVLLMMPLGAVWPSVFTLLAIASLPALFLAVKAAWCPNYLDPLELTDPRGGRRRYLHVAAGLCFLGIVLEVIWLAAT